MDSKHIILLKETKNYKFSRKSNKKQDMNKALDLHFSFNKENYFLSFKRKKVQQRA